MIEKVQIIADEMQPHSRPARIISMKDVAITILSEWCAAGLEIPEYELPDNTFLYPWNGQTGQMSTR